MELHTRDAKDEIALAQPPQYSFGTMFQGSCRRTFKPSQTPGFGCSA
jgi:hypothetical protein